jgi:hypothetical protein
MSNCKKCIDQFWDTIDQAWDTAELVVNQVLVPEPTPSPKQVVQWVEARYTNCCVCPIKLPAHLPSPRWAILDNETHQLADVIYCVNWRRGLRRGYRYGFAVGDIPECWKYRAPGHIVRSTALISGEAVEEDLASGAAEEDCPAASPAIGSDEGKQLHISLEIPHRDVEQVVSVYDPPGPAGW